MTKQFKLACKAAVAILALCIVSEPQTVLAMSPQEVSQAERALLPDYCNYTQGFGTESRQKPSAQAMRYVRPMGEGFWGMHHYCVALVHIMRAERAKTPPQQRRHHWSEVVQETNYVITDTLSRGQVDFVMFPEIFTNKGKALFKLGRVAEAEESVRLAIQAKSDYWPAYTVWAEALIARGQNAAARSVLEEGLKRNPEAKAISRMLADLGKSGPQAVSAKPGDVRKPSPVGPVSGTASESNDAEAK